MSNFADLTAGTWTVDASHSEVGFTVKHMMVSKVRGKFSDFAADVTAGEQFTDSTLTATVQMASVDTGSADRDGHLKSADFFDVEQFPTMTFVATKVSEDELVGDLTIKDVTKQVTFDLDFGGVSPDPWGGTRAGFEAETSIDRKDFGLTWNVAVETGGVLVGDKIKIHLDIELVKA